MVETGSPGAPQVYSIAALDTLVCRLIERRFRFRPALDGEGRPMRVTVVETHSWTVEPEEPDD